MKKTSTTVSIFFAVATVSLAIQSTLIFIMFKLFSNFQCLTIVAAKS